MALISLGLSQCKICDQIFESGEEIFSTTAFINNPDDFVWEFSDSAMHKSCFLTWRHRKTFVDKYNEAINTLLGNKKHFMDDEGNIFVSEKD